MPARIAAGWRCSRRARAPNASRKRCYARFPDGAGAAHRPRHHPAPRRARAAPGDASVRARGILVGTQMLAKGHDLPNLTLVAVVGIDEGLFSADFRAPEKLAQLLVQVAGPRRARRQARRGAAADPPSAATRCWRRCWRAATARSRRPNWCSARTPASRRSRTWPCCARKRSRPKSRTRSCRPRSARCAMPTPATRAQRPAARADAAPRRLPARAVAAVVRRTAAACTPRSTPRCRRSTPLPEARKVRWSLDVDPLDLY